MAIERRRIGAALLGLAALFGPTAAAQGRAPESLPPQALAGRGIAAGKLVRLDLPDRARGPLSLDLWIQGRPEAVRLEPATVAGDNYRLIVERPDGSLAVRPGAGPTVLRGELPGRPGSSVAATIDEEGLHARILLEDGGELWLDPLGGGSARGDHVLYDTDDVLDPGKTCAAEGPGLEPPGEAPAAGQETAAAGGLKIAELACEADYEYFQDYGTVEAVESRIHSVINAINLQYESEVGITHQITTILVRTSAAQPATSTDPSTLLVQFRNEWNANQAGIQRDVAHLFTGKSLDGSTIGIAYVGVICNGTYGYGLSESDFSSNFASVTDLTAHELGHNWNAQHCSCTGYTMNPYITSANRFEPSATIPTITAFRDSRSCLSDSTEPPPPPPPPTDPSIRLATADYATDAGTIVAGSYLTTHDQDGVVEAISEKSSGGKPSQRRSSLSHTWTFDVTPGATYTFFLDAHHTPNLEGDDFVFSYSLDGTGFTPMLTVTKTQADDALQSYAFGEDVAGTVYVRVEDTDRAQGNGVRDQIYVDHMYILSDPDGVDSTPPSAPTGLFASVADGVVPLDWEDNDEPDLAGYAVHRSGSPSGPYAQVGGTAFDVSELQDSGVVNGTTYYYVVTALDLAGNESSPSSEVAVTPSAGGGPASCHVGQILVAAENLGAGRKRGRADVLVVDELGSAVPGAAVTGTFSGDLSETLVVTTDAAGVAVFRTSGSKKGGLSLTFCVDDVAASSLTYLPGENVETCDVR